MPVWVWTDGKRTTLYPMYEISKVKASQSKSGINKRLDDTIKNEKDITDLNLCQNAGMDKR